MDLIDRQIDTHELHYVLPPENHIVIDLDISNDNAETSKSGQGIHLHLEKDKVEVVRCKDCCVERFLDNKSERLFADDFCSYGEPKDGWNNSGGDRVSVGMDGERRDDQH